MRLVDRILPAPRFCRRITGKKMNIGLVNYLARHPVRRSHPGDGRANSRCALRSTRDPSEMMAYDREATHEDVRSNSRRDLRLASVGP